MRCAILLAAVIGWSAPAFSILDVDPDNPRTFVDDGKPVYLLGDYCWDTFSDPFYPYEAQFDLMRAHGINFARVWVMWGFTEVRGDEYSGDPSPEHKPLPYLRPGPGLARDGLPKADLTRFDDTFFQRLRTVVQAAQERGIYLQLCIFDGWCLKNALHAWETHAFHRDNNINGIDGDPNRDGKGFEFGQLVDDRILELQKQFIDKVVEAVGDCENIFLEVANENPNREWEAHLAEYIHQREADGPLQHLVMPADLPNHSFRPNQWGYEHARNRLLAFRDLKQPLILDTDGMGDPESRLIVETAWGAFMAGGYFDFLDLDLVTWQGHVPGSGREDMRRGLAVLGRVARSVDFARMEPADGLVDADGRGITCLASPADLVVYVCQGFAGDVGLTLADAEYEERIVDTFDGQERPLGSVAGPTAVLPLEASDHDRAVILSVRGDARARLRSAELTVSDLIRGANAAPTVRITSARQESRSVRVRWHDSDPDDNAILTWTYRKAGAGDDGWRRIATLFQDDFTSGLDAWHPRENAEWRIEQRDGTLSGVSVRCQRPNCYLYSKRADYRNVVISVRLDRSSADSRGAALWLSDELDRPAGYRLRDDGRLWKRPGNLALDVARFESPDRWVWFEIGGRAGADANELKAQVVDDDGTVLALLSATDDGSEGGPIVPSPGPVGIYGEAAVDQVHVDPIAARWEDDGADELSWDVSSLPPGNYQLRATISDSHHRAMDETTVEIGR